MKNRLTMSGGKKIPVHTLIRQELCKFVGWILLAFIYGKNEHNIFSEIPKTVGNNPPTKSQRDIHGDTYLNNFWCDIHRPFYCYYYH